MLCPATRRKCTAEPRSAKDRHCDVERGNAAPRRRHSIGAIGEGWARKRTAPRRTGNGPIRSGVEQPSWDRLRMATAQTRYATSGDGKVTHCSVMAKQSRGMQRRWADTGSEGVALRSRAWRRQSEAWQGEGMARQRFDRRRLWNAMQHNGTSWLSGARERLRDPGQCMAMAWRRDALRSNAKEQQCSVMQRQRVALMRRGVAQPRMAGAQLGRDSAHVDSKEACVESPDVGVQDGGGAGPATRAAGGDV